MKRPQSELFLFLPPGKVVLLAGVLALAFYGAVTIARKKPAVAPVAQTVSPEPPPLKPPVAEEETPSRAPRVSNYKENPQVTSQIFVVSSERCSLEEPQKVGIKCGMTYLRVQAVLKEAGYEPTLEDFGINGFDPDLPLGLSCGAGVDQICSAGFQDRAGRPTDWALVFEPVEGSKGAWVVVGEY